MHSRSIASPLERFCDIRTHARMLQNPMVAQGVTQDTHLGLAMESSLDSGLIGEGPSWALGVRQTLTEGSFSSSGPRSEPKPSLFLGSGPTPRVSHLIPSPRTWFNLAKRTLAKASTYTQGSSCGTDPNLMQDTYPAGERQWDQGLIQITEVARR